MLEPEGRQLLLDALRPPPGFAFDRAVGTTFTLDLVALLVSPVAFAMFDVEGEDGRMTANPIAIIEAVRRHAERITIFCQAGQIKVPADFRGAFAYLERSVVAVKAPRPGGIFHPKVWVIRFTGPDEEVRYRFLCLSRNLTFDRSWDTVLRLDGRATGTPRSISQTLAAFVRALPGLAVTPVPRERVAAARAIADEVGTVEWESLPDGIRLERLWPLGHDGVATWPFPDESWRRLAMAPFMEPGFVERFTKTGRGDIVVSRPETLDAIGAAPLAHLERRCVLRSDAESEVDPSEEDGPGVDADAAPRLPTELAGLHAKLYVVDDAWWSRIWTGSANATGAAFSQNVEFLVELKARNTTHGALSLVTATSGPAVGFGRLLEDHESPIEPILPSEDDEASLALDRLAMSIGGLSFQATAAPIDGDRFSLRLVGTGGRRSHTTLHKAGVKVTIRPLSQGAGAAVAPLLEPESLSAEWNVSFDGLTAFFVIGLSSTGKAQRAETSFLIRAELTGAPEDRLERVLASAIRNRSDLLRLLLFLLGGAEPAFGDLVDVITQDHLPGAGAWDPVLGSDALLEPLMRTLSRNPDRLDEIDRLVKELTKTQEGRDLLPDGWLGLWGAVAGARPPVVAKP